MQGSKHKHSVRLTIVAFWLHLYQATFPLHGHWLHLPVPKKAPTVGVYACSVLHLLHICMYCARGAKPGLLTEASGVGSNNVKSWTPALCQQLLQSRIYLVTTRVTR